MPRCFLITAVGSPESDRRRAVETLIEEIIDPLKEPKQIEFRAPFDGIIGETLNQPLLEQIVTVDLLLADATEPTPNLLYELGVRHAIRKPCFLMSEHPENLPSYLKPLVYHRLCRTTEGYARAREEVCKFLDLVREGRPALTQTGQAVARFERRPQKIIAVWVSLADPKRTPQLRAALSELLGRASDVLLIEPIGPVRCQGDKASLLLYCYDPSITEIQVQSQISKALLKNGVDPSSLCVHFGTL
ncbi:hypothetical protein Spa11_25170 [Botrimarina mediterranea]|uniref:Uncharacterized protein n=1 Tax=Botrimarina mediterranea TaxID=2528022 RepID=A0A518K944_9BACT|nr:hypothetical protein Spa11_25170 [Botrimarina mediterranea]